MHIIVISCFLFVCGIVDANNEILNSNNVLDPSSNRIYDPVSSKKIIDNWKKSIQLIQNSNQVDNDNPSNPVESNESEQINFWTNISKNFCELILSLVPNFFTNDATLAREDSTEWQNKNEFMNPETSFMKDETNDMKDRNSLGLSTGFKQYNDAFFKSTPFNFFKKDSIVSTTQSTESQTEKVSKIPEKSLEDGEEIINVYNSGPISIPKILKNTYDKLLGGVKINAFTSSPTAESTESQTEKIILESLLEEENIDTKYPNTVMSENMWTEFNNDINNAVEYLKWKYFKKYSTIPVTEFIRSRAIIVDVNVPDKMNYVLNPTKTSKTTDEVNLDELQILNYLDLIPKLDNENSYKINSKSPVEILYKNEPKYMSVNETSNREELDSSFLLKILSSLVEPKSTKAVGDRIGVEVPVAKDD